MKRPPFPRPSLCAAALACAASSIAVSPARAQVTHVDENDWRQPDRHDALLNGGSPQHFAVELRFGPYLPNIDSEFGGKAQPFADVFGQDCSGGVGTKPTPGSVAARFYFGAEFDYLPLRIPYVGLVGPGLGWGYTSFSNSALYSASAGSLAGQCSAETTTLTIMPMHLSVVLRADELMRRTGIPLVPYGKFGFGLAWWRASTNAGTETCGPGTSGATSTTCTKTVSGDGLTPSLHFAVGLMLSLNFIDPRASARLDETTGVNHAYFFGELWSDKLKLGSDVMQVGATTWVVGLAADM